MKSSNHISQVLKNGMHLLAALLIPIIWIWIIVSFNRLPEEIPLQFDSSGNVNRRGSRFLVFLLPLLPMITWLGRYNVFKLGLYNFKALERMSFYSVFIRFGAALGALLVWQNLLSHIPAT